MALSKTITNSFHDFRLLEISKTTRRPDKHGPFMVSQSGIKPDDFEMKEHTFVLTKRGTWMHLYIFFLMPRKLRHQVAVFDSAKEVVELASTLLGKPKVESIESLQQLLNELGHKPELEDPTTSALMDEIKKKHPKEIPPFSE